MREEFREGEVGVGAILMMQADLPRDEFGHPWQALFYFDVNNNPTRLLTDEAGRVMGYRNNAEGDPSLDPDTYVPLPAVVARAAERQFDEFHRSA
jgi:hypothetical protein